MRIVLDTSVVVSGFRSRSGASFALLHALVERRVAALATPPLFLQYEEVLKRPEQRAVSGLSLQDIDDALRDLAGLLKEVEVRFVWRPQLPDPGDELVLEAAVNGQADALITHNVRDFIAAGLRFGIEVLRPGDLLLRVRR